MWCDTLIDRIKPDRLSNFSKPDGQQFNQTIATQNHLSFDHIDILFNILVFLPNTGNLNIKWNYNFCKLF